MDTHIEMNPHLKRMFEVLRLRYEDTRRDARFAFSIHKEMEQLAIQNEMHQASGPLQNYAHSRDLLVLGFNYALALSVSDAGRKLCLETANNPQQLKRIADKIAKSVDFVEY